MTSDLPSRQALGSNVLSLIVATALANAVRFLTNVLLAWTYGPKEHGRFAVVFGLISLLIVIGEMGIVTTFGVRQIALATQGDRSALSALTNRLSGLLLLMNLVIVAAVWLLAEPMGQWLKVDSSLLRLVAVWPIGFCLYRLTVMVANGLEAMTYSAGTTAIFHGIWLVWLGIGLVSEVSLDELLVGFSIAFVAAGFASWLIMPSILHRWQLRWRPWFSGVGQMARTIFSALPYALPQMGVLILPSVVCLLIITWKSQDQVSFFQIAYSLAILAHLVALPVAFALLPRLTRLMHGDIASQEAARDLVRTTASVLIALSSLIFALYWIGGDTILNLMGPAYAGQHTILFIIAASVIFDVHRTLIDQLLMASRHVTYTAWSEMGRYVVLFTVAYWTIPRWGAEGAAAAVAASMIVNFFAKLAGAHYFMGMKLWDHLLAVLGLLALMLATGQFAENRWLVLAAWLVAAIAFRVVRPIACYRWCLRKPI